MKPSQEIDQRILTAITQYTERQEPCGYQQILAATGLPKYHIKEGIDRLVTAGYIKRPTRGIYVAVPKHPEARTISRTVLPDGSEKLEFAGRDGGDGEALLLLTPQESRMMARLYIGVNVG